MSTEHAAVMLRAAADARKCWACGCLRHVLDTLNRTLPAPGYNDAPGRSIRHASASSSSVTNV